MEGGVRLGLLLVVDDVHVVFEVLESRTGLSTLKSIRSNRGWCRYLALLDLESGLLKCMHNCCKNRALFSQVLRLERCATTCILHSGLLRARKWLANCAKKGSIHVSHAEVEISESQPRSTTCQSLFPVSIIPPWAPLNGKILLGIQKVYLRALFWTGCEG